jgi:hypothetical protein
VSWCCETKHSARLVLAAYPCHGQPSSRLKNRHVQTGWTQSKAESDARWQLKSHVIGTHRFWCGNTSKQPPFASGW